MRLEERPPSRILPSTVERSPGSARQSSAWPATFGLAYCAIEPFQDGGLRHDLARFGVERPPAISRQAHRMLGAGRSARKRRRRGGRSMTQMAEPKWVISTGLRLQRRHFQQLRHRPGRRPHRPGRHLPSGPPTPPPRCCWTRFSSCTAGGTSLRDSTPQERRLCVMHGSALIYVVMPVVILLALFVLITLPFAAARGSGDLHIFPTSGRRLCSRTASGWPGCPCRLPRARAARHWRRHDGQGRHHHRRL